MRLATYNVEWFNALFDDAGQLFDDDGWSARHDVTRSEQTAALGHVFQRLDADAIMVIEGPDTHKDRDGVAALEGFAARFNLRARKAVLGFANQTQQEIMLLYDPGALAVQHDPKAHDDLPRFDEAFSIDLDVDAKRDRVRFSKPPLELAVETKAGTTLRIIGAHLKSKAPHGAKNQDDVMRISIANRRKQLAQAVWLRGRIEAHLDHGDALILMGDLNDGPGLDTFEELFGRSSVEIIQGDGPPASRLFDPHAAQALQRRLSAQPTTARFFIRQEDRYLQALLDYIFVSQDLMARRPAWRIWHPFDDRACWSDEALRTALLTASDHFPVTLDIEIE